MHTKLIIITMILCIFLYILLNGRTVEGFCSIYNGNFSGCGVCHMYNGNIQFGPKLLIGNNESMLPKYRRRKNVYSKSGESVTKKDINAMRWQKRSTGLITQRNNYDNTKITRNLMMIDHDELLNGTPLANPLG